MDTTGMTPSPTELQREFEDRAEFMTMLYPAATHEIQATVDLVRDNPDLCKIGHELFCIIAQNNEATLVIDYPTQPAGPDMSYLL